ncbi:FNIP repeat-containing protein [Reticulomyxa filosa]|uniref:FNIP repeat-containing protein n=1 Tax=Reticulomyxa filosa TaxID=46433 RepID=X6NWE9_RETFI|nr:FNIP repeat-containing protein [Reticulomyxa filosa]|eukprot:ETO30208.1 FNIP repeat-containing protein [Reticulomyxa filosa]
MKITYIFLSKFRKLAWLLFAARTFYTENTAIEKKSSYRMTELNTESLRLLQALNKRLKRCHKRINGVDLSSSPLELSPISSPRQTSTTSTNSDNGQSNGMKKKQNSKLIIEESHTNDNTVTAGTLIAEDGPDQHHTDRIQNSISSTFSPKAKAKTPKFTASITPNVLNSPQTKAKSPTQKPQTNVTLSGGKPSTDMPVDVANELTELLLVAKQMIDLIDGLNSGSMSINDGSEFVFFFFFFFFVDRWNEDAQEILYELYNAYLDEYGIAPSANYLLRYGKQRGVKINYAQAKEFVENINLLGRIRRNNELKQELEHEEEQDQMILKSSSNPIATKEPKKVGFDFNRNEVTSIDNDYTETKHSLEKKGMNSNKANSNDNDNDNDNDNGSANPNANSDSNVNGNANSNVPKTHIAAHKDLNTPTSCCVH